MSTEFVLRSTASVACSVSAYGVRTSLVDSAGRLIEDDVHAFGGGIRRPDALLVRPGQLVSGSMGWAHVQGQGPAPRAIVVLPQDDVSVKPVSRLVLSLAGVHPPPKPLNHSNIGPWRTGWGWADVDFIGDAGAVSALTLRVHAPPSAPAHSVLSFSVDLVNPTDRPISLRPCPTVQVTATVVPEKEQLTAGTRGRLNCSAAPSSVPAGGTVRFAAQVDTAGVPAGGGRVTWALVTGSPATMLVSAWAPVTFGP